MYNVALGIVVMGRQGVDVALGLLQRMELEVAVLAVLGGIQELKQVRVRNVQLDLIHLIQVRVLFVGQGHIQVLLGLLRVLLVGLINIQQLVLKLVRIVQPSGQIVRHVLHLDAVHAVAIM